MENKPRKNMLSAIVCTYLSTDKYAPKRWNITLKAEPVMFELPTLLAGVLCIYLSYPQVYWNVYEKFLLGPHCY